MSKVNAKEYEIETGEQNIFEGEGFLVNSEEEAVSYYSDNNVKRFFKNPFNPKYKSNSDFKGNNSLEKGAEVDLKEEKKYITNGVEKKQLKLKGDSGYDCNYYSGSNHLAKDYKLRKKERRMRE